MSSRLECEEALALLIDFVKQELPADVANAVQQHIEACRPCEQQARYETNFVMIVSQRLRLGSCPDDLRDRVLEALRRESSPQ